MAKAKMLAPPNVESKILEIRGERVMLDTDLAGVYGVTTKALNQAIKRNADRFPEDFRFQLTTEEVDSLRSQTVTSKKGRGGRRYVPWVFTEHGALMAANVLNSPRAVEMSVFVVRAFVRLREYARGHTEIAKRLDSLEQKVAGHDEDLKQMFAALRSTSEHGTCAFFSRVPLLFLSPRSDGFHSEGLVGRSKKSTLEASSYFRVYTRDSPLSSSVSVLPDRVSGAQGGSSEVSGDGEQPRPMQEDITWIQSLLSVTLQTPVRVTSTSSPLSFTPVWVIVSDRSLVKMNSSALVPGASAVCAHWPTSSSDCALSD
jgi:hypothetical protein